MGRCRTRFGRRRIFANHEHNCRDPLTEPVNTGQAEFDEEHEQWSEDNQIAWRKEMDSADLAYILYQVPVLVAVHASEMLTLK